MNIQQISLLGILLTGIPFAVFLAKDNCVTTGLFGKLIGISLLLIIGGILFSEVGSPHLFGFFVVGWWMMYHSIALRFNDLKISKWKSLWSLIPIILIFTLFQCAITKRLKTELIK